MLQVRENEISLCKWAGGTAQLLTFKGTMNSFRWILVVSQSCKSAQISLVRLGFGPGTGLSLSMFQVISGLHA